MTTVDTDKGARLLVAPDAFKGPFEASEVAEAIATGLARTGARADRCPVADGGEGTLAVVLDQRGGSRVEASVHDPLGRARQARFGVVWGDPPTAVVETATAIGLDKLAEDERDPWAATTRGAGELIVAAVRAGAERILVATGGSATVDGGVGALTAIDEAGGLGGAKLVVLCDVETPWRLCAEVFGPQKGADEAMVRRLAERLARLAASLPGDPTDVPRTGAAGGLSGALWRGMGRRLRAAPPTSSTPAGSTLAWPPPRR